MKTTESDLELTAYISRGGSLLLREGLEDEDPESWPSKYREHYGEPIPDNWREVMAVIVKKAPQLCEHCLAEHSPDDNCPCYTCGIEMHPQFIVCAVVDNKPVAICPRCDRKRHEAIRN